MTRVAYAIFDDENSATKAVDALVESNFTMRELHVLFREGAEGGSISELRVDMKTWIRPAMTIGVALGATLGALVAVVTDLLTSGPLLALFQGAIGGGAAGLFLGFVAGLGYQHVAADFPHDHHHGMQPGAFLVGASTENEPRLDVARHALERAGAGVVHVRKRIRARAELKDAHRVAPPPLLHGVARAVRRVVRKWVPPAA